MKVHNWHPFAALTGEGTSTYIYVKHWILICNPQHHIKGGLQADKQSFEKNSWQKFLQTSNMPQIFAQNNLRHCTWSARSEEHTREWFGEDTLITTSIKSLLSERDQFLEKFSQGMSELLAIIAATLPAETADFRNEWNKNWTEK